LRSTKIERLNLRIAELESQIANLLKPPAKPAMIERPAAAPLAGMSGRTFMLFTMSGRRGSGLGRNLAFLFRQFIMRSPLNILAGFFLEGLSQSCPFFLSYHLIRAGFEKFPCGGHEFVVIHAWIHAYP